MATKPGGNEGFRVLEDFACKAIPGPESAIGTSPGSGVNVGIAVSESADSDPPFPVGTPRAGELRSLSNAELVALVKLNGSTLSRGELWIIHEIAVERSTQGDAAQSKDAEELSRNAMLATLNRIAEQADPPEP